MILFTLVADFFAGVFLCNCIPHLVSGLRGETFPTPFANPPGKGLSSALVNFLWGTFNLIVGVCLLVYNQFVLDLNVASFLFYAGFVLCGVWLAQHFSSVRSGRW